MVLLAGNSHPGLAEEIARHLGVGVGSCLVYHNTNRETMVDIQESVRGKAPKLCIEYKTKAVVFSLSSYRC